MHMFGEGDGGIGTTVTGDSEVQKVDAHTHTGYQGYPKAKADTSTIKLAASRVHRFPMTTSRPASADPHNRPFTHTQDTTHHYAVRTHSQDTAYHYAVPLGIARPSQPTHHHVRPGKLPTVKQLAAPTQIPCLLAHWSNTLSQCAVGAVLLAAAGPPKPGGSE